MAKTYDFRFTLRRAEFDNGFATIAFSGREEDTYVRVVENMTFADAKLRLADLSAAEKRSHYASLSMARSGDRVPPGFNKEKQEIWFDAMKGQKAA